MSTPNSEQAPGSSSSRVWIGLGGNVGDVRSAMQTALAQIAALPETRIEAASALYRTKPWGDRDQDDFLNACLRMATALAPIELLAELKRIETGLQRRTTRRWGPRTIDLDILVYEGIEGTWDGLTLPHPRTAERIFVIRPLFDLNPQLVIEGKTVETHLDALIAGGEGSEIELQDAADAWSGQYLQR